MQVGGGASVGIEAATNRRVDVAINHDPVALAVHCANHPRTRHLEADIWEVKPRAAMTAGGNHVAEVRAFLTCYYGNDEGQRVDEPMRTLTTKHRLGLVLVRGIWRQVADIGMRMLQPPELLRGQFGRFAGGYDLSKAETKEDQVRLIGNSVPPEVVEQLVANLPLELLRAA